MKRIGLLLLACAGLWGCNSTPASTKNPTASTSSGAGNGSGNGNGNGGSTGNVGAGSNGSNGTNNNTSSSSNGVSSGTIGHVTGSTGVANSTTTTTTAGTNAGTSGTNATNGQCVPDGTFVGEGNASLCCSLVTDGTGYCGLPSNNGTSGNGTTGGGTTGTAGTVGGGTGTVTTGTCPQNIPNINSGQTQNPQPCSSNKEAAACPQGFTCINGDCILNGGAGGVQVTLSFDDDEDLDLHVREPKPNGSYCEIYYGQPGPVDAGLPPIPIPIPIPTPPSCSVGWLDRDSNAACNIDGVNIENVIYPTNVAAPAGTYSVYVDYWEACDSIPATNFAVQVRANGANYLYCGTLDASQADSGGIGSGIHVADFTVP